MGRPKGSKNKVSRSQAIKQKCLECSGGIRAEVKECPITDCALYRFRLGYELDDNGKRVKKKKKEGEEGGVEEDN